MSDSPLSEPHILVINAGSSTLKFAGFSKAHKHCLYRGILDQKGSNNSVEFRVDFNNNQHQQTHETGLAVTPIINWLTTHDVLEHVVGIGHRVVHGGQRFTQPTLIDANVIEAIRNHSHFAPLHNPANLRAIENCIEHFNGVPQVAVFDTAFHQTMPPHSFLYPLPYEWYQNHEVRRYGFHGTSHAYVAEQAAKQLNKPLDQCQLISVHLGNGCSACAIYQGKSVDTTMGLTPLEGLMMGTRSGNLDPGLAEFLCKRLNLTIDQLTLTLNKKSGLLGISQLSSDMRELQAAANNDNPLAKLAIDMFCYRAAKSIAEMLVPLDDLDALIFTGGIGENAKPIRDAILQHLHFLRAKVLVIATNEEKMIAQQSLQIIKELH
ncbi:MAG: acetate kinase [Pseudomonadales bacterium]|nr:acetate kinase [Pseudomonadales bacterium]